MAQASGRLCTDDNCHITIAIRIGSRNVSMMTVNGRSSTITWIKRNSQQSR